MAQVTLDECLNPALRTKIKKLVELNLDSDSIWDLLDPNLKTYEDYMYAEVEKYVKYILWLRETDRSLDNAYERYKNYTQNINRNFKRDLANRLELEQKRKDQQRIDELSALMKYSRRKKQDSNQANDLNFAEKSSLLEVDEKSPTETTTTTQSILEFSNEQVQPNNSKKSEIGEENNNEINDGEDTESDLDFIDLATSQSNEPSVTLNTKDLLFETMGMTKLEKDEVTAEMPLEITTQSEIKQEKTLTIQTPIDGNQTNEALAFYQQLEDKYGDEATQSPVATYELGSKINYHNEEYLIVKIEMIKDYFNKYEVVITLKNVITNETIRVNRKQIEHEN